MAKNSGVTRNTGDAVGGGGLASAPTGKRPGNGSSSFGIRNAGNAVGGGGLAREDWQTNAPPVGKKLAGKGTQGAGRARGTAAHVSTPATPLRGSAKLPMGGGK